MGSYKKSWGGERAIKVCMQPQELSFSFMPTSRIHVCQLSYVFCVVFLIHLRFLMVLSLLSTEHIDRSLYVCFLSVSYQI